MQVVLTTLPTESAAFELAEKIVTARLAACVQVLPQMTSIYFWEGKIQQEPEHLILIKTTAEKYSELETFIQQNHSYDVPEIVAIEANRLSEPYRRWLDETLRSTI